MLVLTDDVEIFRWLEMAGMDGFDPGRPAVFEFGYEEHQALFIFNPEEPVKGCRLFLWDRKERSEAGAILLRELLGLPDDPGFAPLKNEALAIAERLIATRSSDLFFDAH